METSSSFGWALAISLGLLTGVGCSSSSETDPGRKSSPGGGGEVLAGKADFGGTGAEVPSDCPPGQLSCGYLYYCAGGTNDKWECIDRVELTDGMQVAPGDQLCVQGVVVLDDPVGNLPAHQAAMGYGFVSEDTPGSDGIQYEFNVADPQRPYSTAKRWRSWYTHCVQNPQKGTHAYWIQGRLADSEELVADYPNGYLEPPFAPREEITVTDNPVSARDCPDGVPSCGFLYHCTKGVGPDNECLGKEELYDQFTLVKELLPGEQLCIEGEVVVQGAAGSLPRHTVDFGHSFLPEGTPGTDGISYEWESGQEQTPQAGQTKYRSSYTRCFDGVEAGTYAFWVKATGEDGELLPGYPDGYLDPPFAPREEITMLSNPCAAATPENGGNGPYCGSNLNVYEGMAPNILFNCQSQSTTSFQVCDAGCNKADAGYADSCN